MTRHAFSDLHVDAHVRPALVLDPVDAKLETLRSMETEGRIEELSIHAWPGTVSTSATGTYGPVLDAISEFRSWAEIHDVDLGPAFEIHTVSSSFLDRTDEVIRTPVMTLALYAGDELAAVYPHVDPDGHHTVTEAIAALRTGEFGGRIRAALADAVDRATGHDRCGDCDQQLANVQGVSICPACGWPEGGSTTKTPVEVGRAGEVLDDESSPAE